MTLSAEALARLRCPACGERSLANATEGLVCLDCASDVPTVLPGVPSFASVSDAGFDERWRKHPAPQPTPIEQWVAKTGLPLTRIVGKTVFDAGCGIGRYCRFLTEHGAHAVGVDISLSGLAAAQANAPSAELYQADLTKLPFADEVFDYAVSIGVLHHLPSTEAGFREVARTVRRGGELAVWVYTNPVLEEKWRLCVDFLHEVTRACPPEALYSIISRYAVPIRDAYHPEWGPVQQILRPAYNPSNEQCISDMFDWHTPQYRWYHTAEELKGWFEAAGFDVVWTGTFPVSMRGCKR